MSSDHQGRRDKFFERLRQTKPTSETIDAIQRLEAFAAKNTRVRVEYTNNRRDHSILVYVPSVSETASLFKVESSGAIELMNDLHGEQRVKKGLAWLGYLLGAKEASLDNRKPRFRRGQWEAEVAKIIRLVDGFAEDVEDIVAYADPLRARTVRPTASAAAAPPPPGVLPQPKPSFAAAPPSAPPSVDPLVDWTDPRVRIDCTRWLRSWQSDFRDALLREYEERCCISNDGPPEVLQAAHIQGHAESRENAVSNGLLLRADLHALFDAGLLRIEPDTRTVVIDRRAPGYACYHGVPLREPMTRAARPDRERLRARWIATTPPETR